MESYVPNLIDEGSDIAAFPTPAGAVVVVSAEQFASDLQAELDRVE
jgi:hypothetical protein